MTYLLDSNILIFWINKETVELSKEQQKILTYPSSQLYISNASLHEIAIKVRKGSNPFNIPYKDAIKELLKRVQVLPVKNEHINEILNVPKVFPKASSSKPHGDPFDLLIIAQSIYEEYASFKHRCFLPFYPKLKVIN
jgi:PIN domain nuclease of toxin-antitoxin system